MITETIGSMNKIENWVLRIQEIASDLAQKENCELYDVEVTGQGAGRVLTIYLDKEGGVGIDECSNVSRALSEILDAEGAEQIVPGGEYSLEVSSPGLERKLRTAKHFQAAIGKKIWLQLKQNLSSLGLEDKALSLAKKFEDVLVNFENGKLVFEIKNQQLQIPLEVVEKAHVVFEMKQNESAEKKNPKNHPKGKR